MDSVLVCFSIQFRMVQLRTTGTTFLHIKTPVWKKKTFLFPGESSSQAEIFMRYWILVHHRSHRRALAINDHNPSQTLPSEEILQKEHCFWCALAIRSRLQIFWGFRRLSDASEAPLKNIATDRVIRVFAITITIAIAILIASRCTQQW